MGQATQAERSNSQGDEDVSPVEIYGPEGTRDLVRALLQLTYSRIAVPHVIHELKNIPFLHSRFVKQPPPAMVRTRGDAYYNEQRGGRDIYPDEQGVYQVFEDGDMLVQSAPMQHTVPSLGYVVQEKDRVGRLRLEVVKPIVDRNVDALRATFPNPLKVFARLKGLLPGESFSFPDGTVVTAAEALEAGRRGRKVVVMGDTCSGEAIARLSVGADVVVHEATNAWLREMDAGKHADPRALERDTFSHGHSTPQMAGRFAKQVQARRLLLTHFSPRYRGDDSEGSMKTMWRLEDLARETSGLVEENDVIAAWDLMVYPIHGAEGEQSDSQDAEADMSVHS
jgi:ribonuclease Z